MKRKGFFARLMNKWDYELHQYVKFLIPAEWKVVLACDEMDEKVNCCQCGKEVEFGNTYSSQEFHNEIGFGYAVCEECHEKEMERAMRKYE